MKESQINFVNSSASKKKLHSQAGNKLNQARKIKSIFIMIQERTNLFFSSSSLFLQSLLKSCQAAAGIFQIWCLFVSPMPRQFSYFSSHRLLTLFPYLNVSPVYFPGVFSYISQIPDFSSFLIQPVVLHCLIYLSQIPPPSCIFITVVLRISVWDIRRDFLLSRPSPPFTWFSSKEFESFLQSCYDNLRWRISERGDKKKY